jgi:hypothetical protein
MSILGGSILISEFTGGGSGGGGTPISGAAGGDLTGFYPNPLLAATGVSAGTYGSSSLIPVITVNAKGQLTNVTTASVPSLVTSFIALTDTPSTYAGAALKVVRVKATEDGLEFFQTPDFITRTEAASVSAGLQLTKTSVATTDAISSGFNSRLNTAENDIDNIIANFDNYALTTEVANVTAGLNVRLTTAENDIDNIIANFGNYVLVTTLEDVSAGLNLRLSNLESNINNYTLLSTTANLTGNLQSQLNGIYTNYALTSTVAAVSAGLQLTKAAVSTVADISAGLSTRINGKISTGQGSAGNWNNVIVNSDGIVTSGAFVNYGGQVDLSPYTLRTETIATSSNIVSIVAAVSAGLQDTKTSIVTTAAISSGFDTRLNSTITKTEVAAISAGLQDTKTSNVTTAAISAGLDIRISGINSSLGLYTLKTETTAVSSFLFSSTAAASANLQDIKTSVVTTAAISAGLNSRIGTIEGSYITSAAVAALSGQLTTLATTANLTGNLQGQITTVSNSLSGYSTRVETAAVSSGLNTRLSTVETDTANLKTPSYVVLGTSATLANERTLAVAPELYIQDGGANSAVTIGMTATGVTPGSYGSTNLVPVITVNSKGQVTSVSTVSISGGGSPATMFISLTDVPNSYAGQSLKGVRVNAVANGLEFYTIPDYILKSEVADVSAGLQLTKTSNVTTAAISAGFDTRISDIYSNFNNYTLKVESAAISAYLLSITSAVSANLQDVKTSIVTTAAISAGLDTRINAINTGLGLYTLKTETTAVSSFLFGTTAATSAFLFATTAAASANLQLTKASVSTVAAISAGLTPITTTALISAGLQLTKAAVSTVAAISAGLTPLTTTALISAGLQDIKTSVVTTAAISAGLNSRIGTIEGSYITSAAVAALSGQLTTEVETAAVSAGLQLTKAAVTTVAAISAGLDTRINGKISTGQGSAGNWNNVIVNSDGIVTSGAFVNYGGQVDLSPYTLKTETAAVSAFLFGTTAAASANLQDIKTSVVTTAAISAGLQTQINNKADITALGLYTLRTETVATSSNIVSMVASVSANLQDVKTSVVTTAAISAGFNSRIGTIEGSYITSAAVAALSGQLTTEVETAAVSAGLQLTKAAVTTVAAISAGLDTRINGKISTGLGSAGNWNNVIVNSDGIVTSGAFVNYGGQVDLSPYTLKTETASVSSFLFATTAAASANLQDIKTSIVTTAAISAGLNTRTSFLEGQLPLYTPLTSTAAISAGLRVETAAISAGLQSQINNKADTSTLALYTLRTETVATSSNIVTTVAAVSAGLQLTKAAVTTVAAISAGLDTRINGKISTGLGSAGNWNNVIVNADGIVTSGAFVNYGGQVDLSPYTLKTETAAVSSFLFATTAATSANLQDIKTSIVTTAAISAGFNSRIGFVETQLPLYTPLTSTAAISAGLRVETAAISAGLDTRINAINTNLNNYTLRSETIATSSNIITTVAAVSAGLQLTKAASTTVAAISAGLFATTAAVSAFLFSTTAAASANLQDIKTSVVTTAAISAGLAAPSYVVLGNNSLLQNERALSSANGITLVDTGANGSITVGMTATGVTPGTYGSSSLIPVITVDSQGRLTNVTTAISSGGGGGGSGTVSGTGSPGAVAFWNNSTTLGSSTSFTYNDNTNNGITLTKSGLGGGYQPLYVIQYESAQPYYYPYFSLNRARGTSASPSAVIAGDIAGGFLFGAYTTGLGFINTAGIIGAIDGTVTSTTAPQKLSLSTGLTSATPKLEIASNGVVSLTSEVPYFVASSATDVQLLKLTGNRLTQLDGASVITSPNSISVDQNITTSGTINTSLTVTMSGAIITDIPASRMLFTGTGGVVDSDVGLTYFKTGTQAIVMSRSGPGQNLIPFTGSLYENTQYFRYPYIALNRARGTSASPSAVQIGDYIAGNLYGAHDGTTFINTAGFVSIIDAVTSGGYVPQKLQFLTGTTTATPAFEIGSNADASLVGNFSSLNVKRGTFVPEGAQVGNMGDIFQKTTGGTGTSLYVKEAGNANNTGWVGVASVTTVAAVSAGLQSQIGGINLTNYTLKTETAAVSSFLFATTAAASANLQDIKTSIVTTAAISAGLDTRINSINTGLGLYTLRTETIATSSNIVSTVAAVSAGLQLTKAAVSTVAAISAAMITRTETAGISAFLFSTTAAASANLQDIKTSIVTTAAISAGLQTQINNKADTSTLALYTLRTETVATSSNIMTTVAAVSAGLQLTKAAVSTVAAISAAMITRTETAGISAFLFGTTAAASANLQDIKTSIVTTAAISAGFNSRIGTIEGDYVSKSAPLNILTGSMNLSGNLVIDGSIRTGVRTLTGATINVNANDAETFIIPLSGSHVIANPTNGVESKKIIFKFKQDSVGGRTVTWGSLYDFSGVGGSVTLSTQPNNTDYVGFIYNSDIPRWYCLGANISGGILNSYATESTVAAVSAGLQLTKAAVTTVAAISAGLDTRINGKISTGLGSAGNWNNVIVNADGIVTSGAFVNYGGSTDLTPYTLKTETAAVSAFLFATTAATSANLQDIKTSVVTTAAISAGLDTRINSINTGLGLYTLRTETIATSSNIVSIVSAVSAGLQLTKAAVTTVAAISAGLNTRTSFLEGQLPLYTPLTSTAAISAGLRVETAAISAGLQTQINNKADTSTLALYTLRTETVATSSNIVSAVAAVSAGLQLTKAAVTTVAAISANLQDIKTSVVTTAAISAGLSTRLSTVETNYVSKPATLNVLTGSMNLSGSLVIDGSIRTGVKTLVDGANISINANDGELFTVVLGGNRTIDNPTNGVEGKKILLKLVQDGTGNRTVTWSNLYDFSSLGGTAPTLSTAPNNADYFSFIYNSSVTKWSALAASISAAGADPYATTATVAAVSAGLAAPNYVLVGTAAAQLPNERILAASNPITLTDAGAGSTISIGMTASGVTPGTYGAGSSIPVITVDAFGRITSAITVTSSGGGGGITGVGTGTPGTGQFTFWTGSSSVSGSEFLKVDRTNTRVVVSNVGATNIVNSLFALHTSVDRYALIVEAPNQTSTPVMGFANIPLSVDLNTGKAFEIKAGNEANGRAMFYTDGKYAIGPGTAGRDTVLSRHNTSFMKISADGAAASAALMVTGNFYSSNIKRANGTPEGVVTGVVGDIFQRTDGAGGTSLYIKESGAGNTGWTAVAPGGSGGAGLTGGIPGRISVWASSSSISASNSIVEFSDGRIGIGSVVDDGSSELQVNGDGRFTGNVSISGSQTINNEIQFSIKSTSPATPSAGLSLYATDRAGRKVLKMIGPSGIDTSLQPTLGRNSVGMWMPETTTTIRTIGIPASNTGTVSTPTLASTNIRTQTRRFRVQSTPTTAQSAGSRSNQTMCWRGNAEDLGGFELSIRFADGTGMEPGGTYPQQRAFVGLYATTGVIGNVDPSTLVNVVGMAYDSADTTWRIMWNDGSGTCSTTALGPNFPARNLGKLYDVTFFAKPFGSTIGWQAISYGTSAAPVSVSGVITSDMPSNTTFLCPQIWVNTGNSTGGGAAAIECNKVYLETDI